MQAPIGVLQDDHTVLIEDQADANRLYNKGFAGRPVPGGALVLSLVESAHLVEEKRLRVNDKTGQDLDHAALLVRGLAAEETFEIPLLGYRDLRGRGLVAKHANKRGLDFLVYPRGANPKKDPPEYLCGAFSERGPVTASRLKTWLDDAVAEQAKLLTSIVDEDGELTHYAVAPIALEGRAPKMDPNEDEPVAARFLVDRVTAWGPPAKDLHRKHFLGTKLPNGIQMSLVEAAFLLERGRITVTVGDAVATKENREAFLDAARRIQPDLDERLSVYRELADRGLYVKTGFKFGTHFRGYDEHPDDSHAPWLIHVVGPEWTSTWPEISRAIRLAHGVRKTFVLAVVTEGTVHTVAWERVRL